jgi:DNA-binding transcriptional MerR regulator
MRIGKVAQALGVDSKTVTNWTNRPELARFFSPSATDKRRGTDRDITEDDLYVLNTVRTLRATMSRRNTDWDSIAEQLATGYRDSQLPAAAATVDTGLSMLAHTERVLITIQERDSALKRVAELEQRLTDRDTKIDQMHERLLKDISDMKAQLARADQELEFWRSGRLRPE